MAGYNKFDPRLETLVVETRTVWSHSVGESLSEAERHQLALAAHRSPSAAESISYERTHTGFIREINITTADLERLLPATPAS